MDKLAILQVGDPGNQYFHRSKTNYPMITQGLPFERNTQFGFVGHSVAAGGIHNNKPIPNIYIYIYIYIYAVLYAYIIYLYISIFCIVGGCETPIPYIWAQPFLSTTPIFFDAEKTCI